MLAIPIARLISKNVRKESNDDCVVTTSVVSFVILASTLLFSLLPFMGVGDYVYWDKDSVISILPILRIFFSKLSLLRRWSSPSSSTSMR